ncbi:MAG: hypothetical protein INH40_23130 [Acidobacteriaceae bacterium]|nr:hypothetical protein [Acidobacteriaceae bacterium]
MRPVAIVFGLWAISLGMVAVLAAASGTFGLAIVPLGEDFNWVYFLRHDAEFPAPRAFWEYDARNPLAPWWYLTAKPLIVDTAYGLYAVRRMVDLLCGLAVYSVVVTLGGAAYRRWALAASGLTMLWTCSQMVGQIHWTMLLAMALGLWCVAAYIRFLHEERREVAWYALSLVLYLTAIATYSLQASVVLGVAALGMRRAGWRRGLVDAAPFAALLGLFCLIWATTGTVPHAGSRYTVAKLAKSLSFLVWDPIYHEIPAELWRLQPGDFWVAAGAGLVVAVLFWRVSGGLIAEQGSGRLAVELLLVALGMGATTVLLEAGNPVWLPGTRAPMVQQGLTPLLILALALVLEGQRARGLLAAAWAAAAFLSLCHNARQVRWSADLERIAAGLQTTVPQIQAPTVFVLTTPPLSLSPYNSDIFVKNLYRSDQVNLRIFSPSTDNAHRELTFDSDQKGLYTESSLGQRGFQLRSTPAWIPYHQVVLMRYDRTGVRPLGALRREDTQGYTVVFHRATPLVTNLAKTGPPLPLDRWELQGGTYTEPGVFALRGHPASLAQHPVSLEPGADYVITLEARAEGDTRNFYADFYGVPAYDAAAQDYAITEPLGPEFRWLRFVIPAGPQPPPAAWLRLVNPSPGTVSIRSVKISRLDTMGDGLLRP